MKLAKWLATVLAVLVLIGVISCAIFYYRAWRERPYEELRSDLHEIQLQIERYAVENEASYPPDLAKFIAFRKIDLPRNPFGQGKLKLLEPGDPWEPGGIVYIGWGPVVLDPKGKVVQFHTDDSTSSEGFVIPTEIEDYMLVAYSPRHHPQRIAKAQARKQEYETGLRKIGKKDETINPPPYSYHVDYDHAELILTSQEEYVSGESFHTLY